MKDCKKCKGKNFNCKRCDGFGIICGACNKAYKHCNCAYDPEEEKKRLMAKTTNIDPFEIDEPLLSVLSSINKLTNNQIFLQQKIKR